MWICLLVKLLLKVLSNEMDLAESGIKFRRRIFSKIYVRPSYCDNFFRIKRHLVQLLAIRILIAKVAMKFITPQGKRGVFALVSWGVHFAVAYREKEHSYCEKFSDPLATGSKFVQIAIANNRM
jgi:hypothetical protein